MFGGKTRNLVLDMLSRRCLLDAQLKRPVGSWIYEFRKMSRLEMKFSM